MEAKIEMPMFVNEINEIKKLLENMRSNGLVSEWSLPFENQLTRLKTAVFFLTPAGTDAEEKIWIELNKFNHFSFRLNYEKRISHCEYRVTFNKEEKIRNLRIQD